MPSSRTSLREERTSKGYLPADSLIFTTSGPRPIEKIEVGDEVWSYNEHHGIVTGEVTSWAMAGYKPLLTIRTQTRHLRLTTDHIVPVRRRFGLAEGRKRGECAWETIQVRAESVRRGDHLLVPNGYPKSWPHGRAQWP